MLKIGMSACFMYPDPNRVVFGPKTLLYMGHDMSHYLGLSGVMPILIPDLPDEKLFYQFIDQLDGIIFQGGMDINPEMYGETPMNFKWEGDPQRDLYELKILDYAIKKDMPVLGICRGLQLMNIYFNGTLYQDIETLHPNPIHHFCKDKYDEHTHTIQWQEDGLLEKLHKNCPESKTMIVNSVHHQGVKKLGEHLLIEATSPEDGIVEAFSWAGPNGGDEPYKGGRVLAIQWHPEFFHTMDTQTISQMPILMHFISQCKDFQNS